MNSILIIDDEEKIRTLLARIIGLEGFEVYEAATGKIALKKLEIDVALCDVKLPDSNGVELVKTIKQKHTSTEIILLTTYGNIADGVQMNLIELNASYPSPPNSLSSNSW